MPEHHLNDDDQLSAAVRRAFAVYTAPQRPAPLTVAPAPRERRPRLLALSFAGLPAAAALAVVVLVAQSLLRPASAFATWTAAPTTPDPAAVAAASDECWAGMSGPSGEAAMPRIPLVAFDQRGEVAVALFSDGEAVVDCMIVDGELSSAMAVGVFTIDEPLSGTIRLLSHGEHAGDPPVHMVIGEVAPEVASVVVMRDDGLEVTATVSEGFFLAWWPTADDAATFTALDVDGQILEVVDNSMRIPDIPDPSGWPTPFVPDGSEPAG